MAGSAPGKRNEMSKFAIEGLVDGQWSRQSVGDVNDTTVFDSREEAEEARAQLATGTDGWELDRMRVVEV